MIKLLTYSDLHSDELMGQDEKPDIVVILGDIDRYTIKEIDQAFSCIKIGVSGNHDRPGIFQGTNIIDLHGRTFSWNGITFAGFGGCPRYNSRTYGQYTKYEAEQFITSIREKIDVFIAHANPYCEDGVEDAFDHRKGFPAFNYFIENHQPKLFLHGHLHDPKITQAGKTQIHSVYGCSLISL